jgi:hypothetical protein
VIARPPAFCRAKREANLPLAHVMQHCPQGGAVSGPEGRPARCAIPTRTPRLVRPSSARQLPGGSPKRKRSCLISNSASPSDVEAPSISALFPSSSPHSVLPPPSNSSHRVQFPHAAHPAGHGHRCPGCAVCDRFHHGGSSCRFGYRLCSSCFSPSRAPSEEAPITVRLHHTRSRSAHTSRARCMSTCTIGVK